MIQRRDYMVFNRQKIKWAFAFLPVCLLTAGQTAQQPPPLVQTIQDGRLIIQADTVKLLTFQMAPLYPPAGVDTVYKRSAFIHPLRTPHGQVLTRIQPPDHFHHYGIWNAWTHVLFEGDTIDFWNLNKRQGTVRFRKLLNYTQGQDFCEYDALLEHVAFYADGSEKITLNETHRVRIYPPRDDRFIVDFTLTYQCATPSPFRILEYRYAGMAWRATGAWHKDNSEVMTSEEKNRNDSDGSPAKWFLIQGELGSDYGGILICSHPFNYNHPEPLRIWPETMVETGDVFAMFAPTKNKDWLMEPGKTYTLKYRFLVFNGHLKSNEAEETWQKYTDCENSTEKQ